MLLGLIRARMRVSLAISHDALLLESGLIGESSQRGLIPTLARTI